MSDFSSSAPAPSARFKMFQPILAGATVRDRVIACVGAVLGISLTGLVSALALGQGAHLPLIIAPLGASAVLVFAVPASPLAQPWSVIGGNTISAIIGVAVAMLVPDTMLASGLAVGLAIAAMSLTRSLHPPGGAMALTAVIGGHAVAEAGFMFALVPACLNSLLLAGLAWAFHRFSGHSYPHVPAPAPKQTPTSLHAADIDAALKDLGETFDINREDLGRLLERAEQHAQARAGKPS
ncbi:MAG: HPP family protein [Terricaulis sp.]